MGFINFFYFKVNKSIGNNEPKSLGFIIEISVFLLLYRRQNLVPPEISNITKRLFFLFDHFVIYIIEQFCYSIYRTISVIVHIE